jgi:hypothetical protein
MISYIRRDVEALLQDHLRWAGGVVIDGPKAVGKTETGTRFVTK